MKQAGIIIALLAAVVLGVLYSIYVAQLGLALVLGYFGLKALTFGQTFVVVVMGNFFNFSNTARLMRIEDAIKEEQDISDSLEILGKLFLSLGVFHLIFFLMA